ncbi:MAG: hypothetical protein LC808_34635 [Actinobacteria bacterium]|nr:hypothetical protein [Actinomycetota bacterium]
MTIDSAFKNRGSRLQRAMWMRVPLVAVAAAGLLIACSDAGSESAGAEASQVEIHNFDFQPDPIHLTVGSSVQWTNQDDILHTITSGVGQKQGVPGVSKNVDAKPDGLFDQEMDGVGSTFSFTFKKAGSYRYYCSIHPGMRGTIEVE